MNRRHRAVPAADGKSVTARLAGKDVKLVKDEMERVEGYDVTLTEVEGEGEDVTIRIVGD